MASILLARSSCMVLALLSAGPTQPSEIRLAESGKALTSITVSSRADSSVRALGQEMAGFLRRMSGAEFTLVEGDGRQGIALGTPADFPALDLGRALTGEGFGADEQYLLRSHARGIHVIGASPIAVQHAAWDLLHRLGCRWYFPGDVWEVVPHRERLAIAIDVRERPAYAYRLIWPGSGHWPECASALEQWRRHNRVTSTFRLVTGHAYERILAQQRKAFDAHPEWLALVDGKRVPTKLCVSNPELRKLVCDYVRKQLTEHPEERCVSVEPSDGGGWCRCDGCLALGTPSDRAITLANEVAAMLEKEAPGKYAALYAYNEHSPPPKVTVHPRVIVSCATAFIRGGLTIDDMILGWQRQGVRQFGIREYYSVNTWDRDLPRAARGGDLEYLARTIPHFHAMGARFMSAEASDNWGPNGLGYYVATRMLWDVNEAARVPALVDDFLDNCFGPARGPMAEFYAILHGPERPVLARQLVGRMYGLLDQARRQTDAPAVRARLDALLLYVRYVELFRTYQNAAGPARQTAFEQLIRHGYRMLDTQMVHTRALCRDLPHRDKSISLPAEAQFGTPAKKNPWRQAPPWNAAELDKLLADGLAANPRIDYTPWKDPGPLVKPTARPETDRPAFAPVFRGHGQQVYYTWFDRAPATLKLTVTGGLIAHYRDRGNVKLELSALGGEGPQVVDRQATTPPDGKPYEVMLRSDRVGLHKLVLNDGGDMTEVRWPDDVPCTYPLGGDEGKLGGRRSGYFFVPRGTRTVVLFATRDRSATLRDSAGRTVFRFAQLDGPDLAAVPVPQGEDGAYWSFHDAQDRLLLLNVPPYGAAHPRALLLPQGVADSR